VKTEPKPQPKRSSKRELEIHRFLKKKRYEAQREDLDQRFPFKPDPHPDVEDFSKDG
jgi:hypothetical protein